MLPPPHPLYSVKPPRPPTAGLEEQSRVFLKPPTAEGSRPLPPPLAPAGLAKIPPIQKVGLRGTQPPPLEFEPQGGGALPASLPPQFGGQAPLPSLYLGRPWGAPLTKGVGAFLPPPSRSKPQGGLSPLPPPAPLFTAIISTRELSPSARHPNRCLTRPPRAIGC